jgi:hypothetical protein
MKIPRVAIAAFASLCVAYSATAQPIPNPEGPPGSLPCFPLQQILLKLGNDFGEVPESVFVSNGGAIFTLTVNRESGTWTVLVQNPQDLTCIVSVGDNFIDAPESLRALAIPGEDS